RPAASARHRDRDERPPADRRDRPQGRPRRRNDHGGGRVARAARAGRARVPQARREPRRRGNRGVGRRRGARRRARVAAGAVTRTRRAVPALLVLLVASATACATVDVDRLPDVKLEPAPGGPATTAANYSGIPIAGVPGTTTTSVPAQGKARLSGTVTGPDGPVSGATVRAEWFIGDA